MNYKKIDTFSNWTKDEKDQFTVSVIKGLIIDGVRKANSGHPGGPMSLADFSYILSNVSCRFFIHPLFRVSNI